MTRAYFVAYAISFKHIPSKRDGEIHHNWFYMNIGFKTKSNLKELKNILILRDKIIKKHNCKFVQIISIFPLKVNAFKKAVKLEDMDFKLYPRNAV